MPQCLASPEVRQVRHLRLVRDEDDVPYDTGVPCRAWRPMMPPDLYSPDVGPDGIAVYGVLCLHVDGKTGECWPSQGAIAARIGISRERVINAIKRLERCGFVEITHQDYRGMKRSNLYRLPHQISANVQMSQIPTTLSQNGTADVPNPDSRCPKTGHEPYVKEPSDKEPGGNTPLPPKGGGPAKEPTYPSAMLAFWEAYHPKGRERSSKKQVLAEWTKLRPDEATVTGIMAGLAAWSESDGWRRGFAPGAHRFLNLRKWEEPPAAASNDPPPQSTGRHEQAARALDRVLQIAGGKR